MQKGQGLISKKFEQYNSSSTVQIKQSFKIQNGKSVSKIQIGKYQYSTGDILGKGYTGIVYKGTLITDNKKRFAVKAIDMKKFKKREDIALIQKQIEIHKNLKHPNIINCEDIYKTQQFYFIITEYCPHGDLQQLLKIQKVLHEEVALKIMKQIIQAYKYLLSKNIIHRDLKPANFMRFGGTWKIGDFGFATQSKKQFILDKINVGTPLYMPPQSLYYNKYSYKTDIFSIGIIFYQTLTGKTPWQSVNCKQLLQKMQNHEMEIPDVIQDPRIRQFLFKACNIDYYSRMNKDQFKAFSFQQTQDKIIRSKSRGIAHSKSSSLKKMILLTNSNSPKHDKSSKRISIYKSPSQKKNQKTAKFQYYGSDDLTQSGQNIRKVNQNIKIIKNQEQFLERVYFVIQNSKFLKFSKQQINKFTNLLYRFMIKYLKVIANPRQNALKLTCWDHTKKNPIFKNLSQNIGKKVLEYVQNYNKEIKFIAHDDIKLIDRLFPQLSSEVMLNNGFYQNFQQYFRTFITKNMFETKRQTRFVIPIELSVLKFIEKIYLMIKQRIKNGKNLLSWKSESDDSDNEIIEQTNEKQYEKLIQRFKRNFNDN